MRSILRVEREVDLAAGRRSGADALLLSPTLAGTLSDGPRDGVLLVEVGPLSAGRTDDDLDRAVKARPDAIVLAGARGGLDVQHLAAKLAVREAEAGWPDGALGIVALVSTPDGVLGGGSFAGASPRLRALAWSASALAARLGIAAVRDGAGGFPEPLRHARIVLRFAAAAAGVAAIDTDGPADGDALGRECRAAAAAGFAGKIAGHPAQPAVINALLPGWDPRG